MMDRASLSIYSDGILNRRRHVLRSLTRAQVGLHNIHSVVSDRAVQCSGRAVLADQRLQLRIRDIGLKVSTLH